MYTKPHRQGIIHGWCTHLINGGTHECENNARKYWCFLKEDDDMKLDIVMVVPVCGEHVLSMRAALNNTTGWLKEDSWELVDRSSVSWSLIEESVDK